MHTLHWNHEILPLETALSGFSEDERDMYEEIVEELFEDMKEHIHPAAAWTELSVSIPSESEVLLNDTVFHSSYLASRLEGMTNVYGFAITIGHEFWECRHMASDPLEQLLIDTIMKTALNTVFARTATEIVSNLPDKMILKMDNPGALSGWDLSEQKAMLSLFKGADDILKEMTLNDQDVFENKFSMTGIIYVKGSSGPSCSVCPKESCSHRKADFNEMELVKTLYASTEA